MRKARFIAAAMALLCLLSFSCFAGCSDDEPSDNSGRPSKKAKVHKESRGLKMVVDQQTGDMTITRPESGTKSLTAGSTGESSEKNSWTVFVYLCGSDLESGQASATDDLNEMTAASRNADIRFVVEAGGTRNWEFDGLDARKTQRFVIQNGNVENAQTLDLRNMGASDTLADFLTWGIATYPADHTGAILWDHGGGSISGVCLDENFNNDSLSLKELDAALLGAYGKMNKKLDFFGFDACLMGTLETANVIASYADYMYASEEMEPGDGWEYEGIANCLASNPQASGADLGKAVCDTYFDSNKGTEDQGIVTLSVIDLAKIDSVVKNFNTFAHDLCDTANNANDLASIVRGVKEADNYGGNNRSEGYTNMVDLLGLVDACEPYVASSKNVKSALKDAVAYSKAGSTHAKAGGLSVYYPLSVEDANELAVFEQVCVSPYYLTFVDTVERTSAQDAQDALFDISSWFEDDTWEWSSDYDYNDDTGMFGYDSDSLDQEYWSFENDNEPTGNSPLITFAKKPGFDKDGYYGFTLSDKALDYATSVSAYVYELGDDGTDLELGETCDVNGDWDTGEFYDAFDGRWLSLPDGQNLAIYVAETTDDYVVYASPILLNNDETNLRIRQYFDSGKTVVEGAWDGIDDNGMSARDMRPIEKGDEIVPLYYSADNKGDDPDVEGEKYKAGGKFKVKLELLQGRKYEYSFIIDDVYGDYVMTDPVMFTVEDDGTVLYE